MLGDSKLFSLHLFNKEKSNGKDGGRGRGGCISELFKGSMGFRKSSVTLGRGCFVVG